MDDKDREAWREWRARWREEHHKWRHDRHRLKREVHERMLRSSAPWWLHWRLRRRIFGSFFAMSVAAAVVAMALLRAGVRAPVALGAMLAILWIASGALAWQLSVPLAELARVARKIGEGDLDARMHLPPHGAGELMEIADAVNSMVARIQKQIRDQRELLAAVSHEIRTPLGHLRVLLDTARDRGLPDDVHRELEREVLEVDALADQLLASSRLDFGALERRELDMALEAARALERCGVDASVLEVESDDCRVSADPTLLRSALANLVRNAVDHGKGVTRLIVRRTDGHVEVEVDDCGPGFAADDLPRAFEPFYKGQGGGGSLGLGLSLVDRIARAHGGTAAVANRPGGGARVTLRLPLLPR
jgi:two-component system OmpR family sensor kinase